MLSLAPAGLRRPIGSAYTSLEEAEGAGARDKLSVWHSLTLEYRISMEGDGYIGGESAS